MPQQLELEAKSYRPHIAELGDVVTTDAEYRGLVEVLGNMRAIYSFQDLRDRMGREGQWPGDSRFLDIASWNSRHLGILRLIAPNSFEEELSFTIVDQAREGRKDRSAAYVSAGPAEDTRRVRDIFEDLRRLSDDTLMRTFYDESTGVVGMYIPREFISPPPARIGSDFVYGIGLQVESQPDHAIQGKVVFLVGDQALHPERFNRGEQRPPERLAIDTTVSTIRNAIAQASELDAVRNYPADVGITYGTDWSKKHPTIRTHYKLMYDLYCQPGLLSRRGSGIEFIQFANPTGEATHPTKSRRRAVWTLTQDTKPVEMDINTRRYPNEYVLNTLQKIARSYGADTEDFVTVTDGGVLIHGPRADILLVPNRGKTDRALHGKVIIQEHPSALQLPSPQ